MNLFVFLAYDLFFADSLFCCCYLVCL